MEEPVSHLRAQLGSKEKEAGDAELDSKVHLQTNDARGFQLAVELNVKLPSVDDEQAAELVRITHTVCPYSNATRGNIEVTLTANGNPVI